ncbi:hypothetical protein D5S17_22865 [Pseudonocardiaceae bacterium YIM PH 21723]|nr:hypothetical protein D5S17_22865 [Pseudonocardiaceae bacterium YIM PH 21723]
MLPDSGPCRLGIVVIPARGLNIPALQYMILAMNREQDLVQFEFFRFPPDTHRLLLALQGGPKVSRRDIEELLVEFQEQAQVDIAYRNKDHGLSEAPPDKFVVVSQCRFEDNFYMAYAPGIAVLAMGNWQRFMAPPSYVEFVQALLVRAAIAALSPSHFQHGHLGTKGCIIDFTENLEDARQKALSGFVCHHCRQLMIADGQPRLADVAIRLLQRDWLGDPADPRSPASVMAALRYDLFVTKGRQETALEAFKSALRQEGPKQVLIVLGGILLAILVLALGLKTGVR